MKRKALFAIIMFCTGVFISRYIDIKISYKPRDYVKYPPTQAEVEDYINTHNGSSPPSNWYPNGNPWRNLTAEEANETFINYP